MSNVLISSATDKTPFTRWLADQRLKHRMSCEDIAVILHSTKQTISNHQTGRCKPQYVWCIAYGRVFDVDPDEIWEIVNS